MSTPELHLTTLFLFDSAGRIVSNREPGVNTPPLFCLVRSAAACVWAVRADLPGDVRSEIEFLAREELPVRDFRDVPVHAERYKALLSRPQSTAFGPAFEFPETIAEPGPVVCVEDETLLGEKFRSWIPGEIAAGRAPVMAVCEGGYPVSVCFCARSSDNAAEAGVETAEAFRGRGYAGRVTAAWALEIRRQGRIPLYSTAWNNSESLAVARKLGLKTYASTWSLFE